MIKKRIEKLEEKTLQDKKDKQPINPLSQFYIDMANRSTQLNKYYADIPEPKSYYKCIVNDDIIV